MFTMIKLKRPAFLQRLFALPRRFAIRIIRRNPDRYLKQQGWALALLGKDTQWQGYYRTRYGSFKGRVVASASPPSFYVYKPPETLKLKHPHSACFNSQGNGWFSVHFKRPPGDPDSGVMAIERILTESIRLK
jgi:hypothetical protein